MLAQSVRLQAVFDSQMESRVKRTTVSVSLRDVSVAQALRYILDAYDLKYQEIDGITIKIVSEHDDHSSTPLWEIVKRLQWSEAPERWSQCGLLSPAYDVASHSNNTLLLATQICFAASSAGQRSSKKCSFD
jgi:hypothetical protein